MTPTNHQNNRTSSAVSEGAEAGLTLKRGLGGQYSALGSCPQLGRHWQQTALCGAAEAPVCLRVQWRPGEEASPPGRQRPGQQ